MKLPFYATMPVLLFTMGLSTLLMAQELDLESNEARAGYSIGTTIGMNLVNQGVAQDIDVEALAVGIIDVVNGNLKMTADEIDAAIQEFSQMQQAKAEAAIAEEIQTSRDFLVQNALKEGVVTTSSGLQYLVLEESDNANAAMPSPTDTVNVHYHGTLTDGTVFDSSVESDEPISFALNGVIPGWTEGLQLMRVGDKFRFFIPSDLAYGASGAGALIGPNATLIFDVELLDIE